MTCFNIVHWVGEVMKLHSRLAVLLQLALQPTLNMSKNQLPALPHGSDVPTSHATQQFGGVVAGHVGVFRCGQNMVVLFGEDKDSAGGNFVMVTYNVDAKYLDWKVSSDSKR